MIKKIKMKSHLFVDVSQMIITRIMIINSLEKFGIVWKENMKETKSFEVQKY